MEWLASNLPHATASLNSLATVLLVIGLVMVKRGNLKAHRNVMITCFAVSGLFLALYLLHKVALFQTTGSPNRRFPTDVSSAARTVYFTILGTHLLLALTVPPLAIAAIVQGLKDNREKHRKIVRFAFPIWLYVSITGVVVYYMLYWAYPVA
ncbi:hypothetical protein Poly24_06890 [Rosistilla carotiformis]|uniref:DUF420 domain-containing protein n=1 Tax=Rosistilla carotiformis TaxID=2528017 RepID=A0A518JNA9_9BACT|nr:DUF420 domain-containing protein [Rosistilla carotiformis]QDV66998.1 hypothetical protein Poly24_06890 [Rosistilla carotiformis]